METCPKYNRAMVTSFTNNEELKELLDWISDTTIDPASGTLYPDAHTPSIWIPFRFESVNFSKILLFEIKIPVTMRSKDILLTSSMARSWMLA